MNRSYVWDDIWVNDSYSKKKLRQIKAKKKYDMISSIFQQNHYNVILDLGCGAGFISNIVSQNNMQSNIIGIDKSSVAINKAKKMFKTDKVNFITGDICDIPVKNDSANLILCIGSIEHIKNTKEVFNEINRVLKRNGILVIISSNKKSFMYIHRKIKEFFGIWKYGYQKNWESNELINEIDKYGIVKEHVEIQEGIGDFKYITIIDKIVHVFNKNWGRYIFYIGRRG